MKYEKSCGAVIYRLNNKTPEYLLILNKKGNAKGHWGFPKGHVEENETEIMTAQREIKEETGITADIDTKFRCVTHYSPLPDVEKDVVYFAAQVSDTSVFLQESEVADFLWADYETALSTLTHDSDILISADEYIKNKHQLNK